MKRFYNLFLCSIATLLFVSCSDNYIGLSDEELADQGLVCVDRDCKIYASTDNGLIVSPKWLADKVMAIAKKYNPGTATTEEFAANLAAFIYKYEYKGHSYLYVIDNLSSNLFASKVYTSDGKLLEGDDLDNALGGYNTNQGTLIYPYKLAEKVNN